jgi:acetoin utilization protein AcuB
MRTVKEAMTRDVYTISPDDSILSASQLMQRRSIRHVPVVDNGLLVGIITDRDIKRAAPSLLSGSDQNDYEDVMRTTLVSRIMTREPLTLGRDAKIRTAVRLMVENKVGALPVMDGRRVIGIITGYDLLKEFLGLLEDHE